MNAPTKAMILDLRARSCNLSAADALTFRPLDLELTKIGFRCISIELSSHINKTFILCQKVYDSGQAHC